MTLSSTGSYSASLGLFTANFTQPEIPAIATEISGFFMQHKWNEDISHLTTGYWYNSASHHKVRLDEAVEGLYGSSLLDYTNLSSTGQVNNRKVLVGPSVGSTPTCFNDYVNVPAFPLITTDFLQINNATFGGIVQEPFLGEVQTWNLLFANTIPVIAYLNNDDPPLLLGYDYWGAEKRTKSVTRFWAQKTGNISEEVFENFPCSQLESSPVMWSVGQA